DCTPKDARVEIGVFKTTDPITKNSVYIAPDGYNAAEEDDLHKCNDRKANVSVSYVNGNISIRVSSGSHKATRLTVTAGGKTIGNRSISGSGTYLFDADFEGKTTVVATVNDEAGY